MIDSTLISRLWNVAVTAIVAGFLPSLLQCVGALGAHQSVNGPGTIAINYTLDPISLMTFQSIVL